jgi:hypothetical protein
MAEFRPQRVIFSFAIHVVFVLLGILFHSQLHAATLTVGPGQTFTTIQSAINAAATGDTIFVQVGTYSERLNFLNPITDSVDDLTLEGEQTAATVIDGGGTGVVIDLANFKNITVRKLTIQNGTTGIALNNAGIAGAIDITNNIIKDHSSAGILCTASSNLNITNNVIDDNATGISCLTPTNIRIENNIISNNETGASFTGINSGSIGNYNDFFNNSSNGNVFGGSDIAGNPLFVDPTNNDYHLEENSPAIDGGNPAAGFDDPDATDNDIGAYGGPDMDVTPFQVSGLKTGEIDCALPDCSSTATVYLTWNENLAYNIDDYEVFYGTASGSYGNSVTTGTGICNGNLCSYALNISSITPPAIPPPIPSGDLVLAQPTFGDGSLMLHWSWAAGARPDDLAGYNVYYGEQQNGPYNGAGSPKDARNSTSSTITGLTNGTIYYVIIKAYTAPLFFISIKAIDDATPAANESDFSTEVKAILPAPKTEFPGQSNEVSDMPEALVLFPDLPDQNRCFIAAAAYGSAWKPQVRILRSFRDEYLERYEWGRRFIAWYYRTGPPWADYLNQHQVLKPIVRIALLPAVGVAYFYVEATGLERSLILLLLILCLSGAVFIMRKPKRSRG